MFKYGRILAILAIVIYNFSVLADTSNLCPDEEGNYYINDRNRNPQDGGFVSNSADIENESVFIGKSAAVCGSAIISGLARITGSAIVNGEAMVRDNARIFGNARVTNNAQIEGKAQISGEAYIGGNATIRGTAVVRGFTRLESGVLEAGIREDAEDPAVIAEEKDWAKKKKVPHRRNGCSARGPLKPRRSKYFSRRNSQNYSLIIMMKSIKP